MAEFDEKAKKKKPLRKISQQRLKNIGLYYLERFESSVDNLRQVLTRRVNDYAYHNPDFNKFEAYGWIEEILNDFQKWGYLDDSRYAALKVRDYLAAGKPERYIKIKLRQKGIAEDEVNSVLDQEEYDSREMALRLARKKKIGPFRADDDSRRANRTKDMGTLLRAGFDYEIVCEILGAEAIEDEF